MMLIHYYGRVQSTSTSSQHLPAGAHAKRTTRRRRMADAVRRVERRKIMIDSK